MEDKENKMSDFEEDFAEDEQENKMPQELYDEMAAEEQFDNPQVKEPDVDKSIFQEEPKKEVEKPAEQPVQEVPPEISPWEELSKDNKVVKKYIFYVSKDFVPYIDNLSTDERNAYINDAISKKLDIEDAKRRRYAKSKIVFHFIIMFLTICLSAPFVLMAVHKAIMATFDNYKYSQENFENLYRQRFQKDKAYLRSIQYNKEHDIKSKNK